MRITPLASTCIVSLGLKQVGQMRQVGYKFDRWLDLTFMQLLLNQT
jgi:L-amino acid N-acyltransferase YncA